MNLSAFSGLIALAYKDSFDVYGTVQKENANDHTKYSVRATAPTLSEQSCSISFMQKDTSDPTDSDASNPIRMQVKIICGPSINVCKGDKIVANKIESGVIIATYSGIAGLPAVYPTHQEILLIKTGDA
jgi:hypothetical protein